MNADNTSLDSLSERVLGAVFEVSNTLGAGFLEKVYQRALLRELSLRGIRATAEASMAVVLQGAFCGRVFRGSPGRGRTCGGTEMCRTPCQRAHRPVSQLSAGFRPDRVPSRQFPEAQSRVEAGRSWLYRRAQGAGGSRVDQLVCPAIYWTLH